jgi:hypothetical protein
MKKADNFDATKWLIENKITTQSRLKETKISGITIEIEDDEIIMIDRRGEYSGFIEDDGTVSFSVVHDDMDEEFDEFNWKDILGKNHAFVKIANTIPTKVEAMDDYVMITVKASDLTGMNESKLNEKESIIDFKKWKSTLMPFYEEVIKEINQPDMSLNIYSRWVGDFIKYCNTYTSYDNLIKYGFYVQDIKTDEDLKDQLVKFIKYHI